MKTTEDDWQKNSPYDRFSYFIASKVDRHKVLLSTIEKLKLNFLVVSIEKNKHFFIVPQGKKIPMPLGSGLPLMSKSPYIFVAHYDRVEGSPGANDNSIAVFHLLRVAMQLNKLYVDNWMIIFTDKEELAAGENPEKQGSFALAKQLKAWGLEKAKIFNFDTCGTGDTFVFSNLADTILGNSDNPNIIKVKTEIQKLRSHVLETAYRLRLDKVLLAPIPFSDDMGFLRAGLAAQTVTMLPTDEGDQYEALLRNRPEFVKLIISGGIKNSPERRSLPSTWKNMNTPADTPDRLTPQYFDQFVNFIMELIGK